MHPFRHSYRRLFHMFRNTVSVVKVIQSVSKPYEKANGCELERIEEEPWKEKKSKLRLMEFREESKLILKIMTILLKREHLDKR